MMNSVFGALLLLGVSVSAFDDLATPCQNGECYYSIPGSERSMAATIKITGPSSSISDITSAAGWEVLDCSFNESVHSVRLVCLDDNAGCSHVFQGGAEHTIVRLPQHCGTGPFARISKSWISEDQTIPHHVRARMKKRSDELSPVHALNLDADFLQAADSGKGDVSIVVYGSTTKRLARDTSSSQPRHHARDLLSRGLDDTISDEFDIFSSLLSSEDGYGPFIRNTTENTIPLDVNQQFNVFNTSLPCTGNTNAQLSIDANVNLQGEIDLGVIAQGTIIPPKFNKFGLFGTMSADLVGKLSIATDITGEVDSPEITFLNIGLPGLSIPDVISLGPSVSLAAKATANFDINMNLDVGIGYSINNLTIFFPPSSSHNSSAVVVPKDIPLQLSVAPGIQSETSLTAHLIPSLNLGLVAFGVSTAAFLNFDTSATLTLNLNAGANASVDTDGSTGSSGEVNGCVNLGGGVSVNVGLEADSPLFDLLGDATTITLAEDELDFFQQCFPDPSGSANLLGADATRLLVRRAAAPLSFESGSPPMSKRAFSCPTNLEAIPTTVVNKTLSTSSVFGRKGEP